MTPPLRCWHGQNTPQNPEYFQVHGEEIHAPGERQDGNLSNLCSSFQLQGKSSSLFGESWSRINGLRGGSGDTGLRSPEHLASASPGDNQ